MARPRVLEPPESMFHSPRCPESFRGRRAPVADHPPPLSRLAPSEARPRRSMVPKPVEGGWPGAYLENHAPRLEPSAGARVRDPQRVAWKHDRATYGPLFWNLPNPFFIPRAAPRGGALRSRALRSPLRLWHPRKSAAAGGRVRDPQRVGCNHAGAIPKSDYHQANWEPPRA
jgi:hypothetical protein